MTLHTGLNQLKKEKHIEWLRFCGKELSKAASANNSIVDGFLINALPPQ